MCVCEGGCAFLIIPWSSPSPKEKEWKQHGYRSLSSLTVGILGAGTIGSAVAMACKTLGMRVHALVRGNTARPSHIDRQVKYRLYIYIYIYMFVCVCARLCMWASMWASMRAYVSIYIYIYISLHL